MSERVRICFPASDGLLTIDPVDHGIELTMSIRGVELRAVVDLESAWRIADELARVVSMASTGVMMARALEAEQGGPLEGGSL